MHDSPLELLGLSGAPPTVGALIGGFRQVDGLRRDARRRVLRLNRFTGLCRSRKPKRDGDNNSGKEGKEQKRKGTHRKAPRARSESYHNGDANGTQTHGSQIPEAVLALNSDAFARARKPGYARNLQGLSDPHGQLSVPPAGRAPGLRLQPPMPLSPRLTSSPIAWRLSRRRCG